MLARSHVLVVAIVLMIVSTTLAADPTDRDVAGWIEQLASTSYQSRESARRSIAASPGAIEPLRAAARHHPSFEVRAAARELIAVIHQRRRDEQMARLTNPASTITEVDLPGWDRFSRLVGDDMIARTTFAKISDAFPRGVRDLNRFADSIAESETTKLDAYELADDDHVRWAMLIWLDIVDRGNGNHRLSPRIENSLSNASMGPVGCVGLVGASDHDDRADEVVRRLIGRWIETQSNVPSTRAYLQIAMRYGCHDQARRLSELTLATTSSAAAEVTAMLTASAPSIDQVDGIENLDALLWRRVDDARTAHVWQTIASRKTKVRTQVGDVAVAVLLHRHGIDPRDVGYTELQADPVFVFQDCSLGFVDETARQETRARAIERLRVTVSP